MQTVGLGWPRVDRRQVAIVAVLLAVALLAWLVTDERMTGMDDGPGTDPGSLGFYASVWVVMMAAMMFPAVAPMVATFAWLSESRPGEGGSDAGATWAFVAGYLLVWAAFGLFAYAVFELGRSLELDALAWDRDGPYVAAAVIGLAALSQLTPLKDACLRRCRNPIGFLTASWRGGRAGALVMGVEHGGWCVGCCWALIAALFALGVMSVAWMAFVAVLVAIEKMIPWRAVASYGIAVLLAALACAVALVPADVPALTLPGSGMHDGGGMESMGQPSDE